MSFLGETLSSSFDGLSSDIQSPPHLSAQKITESVEYKDLCDIIQTLSASPTATTQLGMTQIKSLQNKANRLLSSLKSEFSKSPSRFTDVGGNTSALDLISYGFTLLMNQKMLNPSTQQDALVRELSKSLNLASCTTFEKLVDTLGRKLRKKKLLKERVKYLETSVREERADMDEVLREELTKATTDLLDAQMKLTEAKKALRAKDDTIEALNVKINDNSADQLIIQLNERIAFYQEENKKQKEEFIEYKHKNEQNEKSYKDMVLKFDELIDQIERQSEELRRESDIKSKLITCIQKLTTTNQIFESELRAKEDLLKRQSTQNLFTLKEKIEPKVNKTVEKAIQTEIIETSNLIENTEKDDNFNKVLRKEFNAHIKLMEEILNEKWISEKSRLYTQHSKLSGLIEDKSNIESDEPSYLDDFLTVGNQIEIPEDLSKSELYVVLNESLVANSILKNFYSESQSQVNKQQQEIQHLRLTINTQVTESQDRVNQLVEEKTNLELSLQSTKEELQRSEEYKFKAIEFEEKCSTFSEEIENLHRNIEKAIEESSEKLSKCHEVIQQQEHAIEALQKEITNKQSMIETLDKEYKQFKAVHEDLEKEHESQIIEIQKQSHDYEEAMSQLEKEKLSLIEEHGRALAHLKLENEQVKAEKDRIRSRVEHLKRKYKKALNSFESSKASLEQQTEDVKRVLNQKIEGEKKLQIQINELRIELRETSAKLQNAEIEKKMLNSRLLTRDEKVSHEKLLLENQMKVKIMSLESEFDYELQKAKSMFTDFLCSVSSLFKDFVEFDKPVSEESVKALLMRVSDRLKLLSGYEQMQSDLQTIRFVLGIQTQGAKVLPYITELQKSLKESKSKVESLERDMKSMKREVADSRKLISLEKSGREWEEWGRKLCNLVSDNPISLRTASEIRFAVEEKIYSSVNNSVVWKRLEQLRQEKQILMQGVDLNIYVPDADSLKPIVLALMSLRRLRRLSGQCFGVVHLDRMTAQRRAPIVPLYSNEKRRRMAVRDENYEEN